MLDIEAIAQALDLYITDQRLTQTPSMDSATHAEFSLDALVRFGKPWLITEITHADAVKKKTLVIADP